MIGISPNTIRNWRNAIGTFDLRTTTDKGNPNNKLSEQEEQEVRNILYSTEYADLSPHKIVAKLADDKGKYICSESTMYRILRSDGATRRRTQIRKADKIKIKPNLVATRPEQVFNWDITFIPSYTKGFYWKVLIVMDMYSRKIMGFHSMEQDTLEQCSKYIKQMLQDKGIDKLESIHGDNGKTLKGQTLASMLRSLGVIQSHSRPRVSNDNAYIESFFGTLKTDYKYPSQGFKRQEDVNLWLASFIDWYNDEPHSNLNYVSPNQRHMGQEEEILSKRLQVFHKGYLKHPERFSRGIRKIKIPKIVCLLPMEDESIYAYLKENGHKITDTVDGFKIAKELVLKTA